MSSAGSSEDWAYFESRWADYVDATKLTGKDKVVQLLECCDDDLRKDLTRNSGGSLSNKTEEEVLAAIKRLAVQAENCMVARVHLHNMHKIGMKPYVALAPVFANKPGYVSSLSTDPLATMM